MQKVVKEREEDRERLRKELHRSRERLHAIDADVQRREPYQFSTSTTQTPTESEDHITAGGAEDISKDVSCINYL